MQSRLSFSKGNNFPLYLDCLGKTWALTEEGLKKMTLTITLEEGITMKVEEVEWYNLTEDGVDVKRKGFPPHTIRGKNLKVEEKK